MKILIVDDAKQTRETLHNLIKLKIDSHYEIAEAADGFEALGLVESFQPDIVLTDILMPKMDGIKLTSILKSQPETKHIFVAAITGLSGEEQVHKIYTSGVDFYIAKPFQLDDLVARLKVITALISHKSILPASKPSVVYNCFKDEQIKHYFVTFSIACEDDIFLIYDYFSNQLSNRNSVLLKDFLVVMIKSYRKMKQHNNIFDLIIEESENHIYLSVRDDALIDALVDLVKQNNMVLEYSRCHQVFSFRINIDLFFLQDSSTKKAQKGYHCELMSASELMIVSSDDICEYVHELQEALLEYNEMCLCDNSYNDSLRLILLNLFDNYTRLFRKIPEFDRVAIALQSIENLIKEKHLKSLPKAKNTQIINYFDQLNKLIETWIRDVVIEQKRKDVHSSDYKIIKSCQLIENEFS